MYYNGQVKPAGAQFSGSKNLIGFDARGVRALRRAGTTHQAVANVKVCIKEWKTLVCTSFSVGIPPSFIFTITCSYRKILLCILGTITNYWKTPTKKLTIYRAMYKSGKPENLSDEPSDHNV